MKKFLWSSIILSLLLAITPVQGYGISTTYTNLDEEQESFDIFEGKPVLIEAMATWCSHCQDEHEELEKLWNSDENTTFQMMTLSIDGEKDDLDTINDYLTDHPSPWVVGWDRDETFKQAYNIQATPTMILFDSDGEFINC
ncbi:MAG: TlpA family protein disulfide reductase, partial [Candidatus Kariarchaeaceae archaeon]